MNKDKKIEMIRKRNELLKKQLEDLKNKLSSEQQMHEATTASMKQKYDEETKQINDLVSELEKINTEWTNIVSDLEKKMNEYDELIQCVREMKKILFETGLKMKIPFSQKMKITFSNYKTK